MDKPEKSMKSRSGTRSSGKYKSGDLSNRYPLLRRCSFEPRCLAQLAKHSLGDPRKTCFIPDGRWITETHQNGKKLVFKEFILNMD